MGRGWWSCGGGAMAGAETCLFCQIARSSTSTTLLHSDDKVVAFRDINPSAFRSNIYLPFLVIWKLAPPLLIHVRSRHYLVIPVEHISTVRNLSRREEDYLLVSHMLTVGKNLLQKDAPECKEYRFGFHRPPFNSVNHLHLHCFALPFIPRWRHLKYTSLGPFGFIEADKLLEKIKP